jgi:hypothetical protein
MLKGHRMPAFTFEKLSPPTVRNAAVGSAATTPLPKTPPVKKPRRLFGHMIDRLVEARVRKNLRKGEA